MEIGTVSLLEMDQDARRRVSVCDGGDDWHPGRSSVNDVATDRDAGTNT